MTNEEFLSKMQDVLQTEEELKLDTVLNDLAEWDSLSVMATMAFLDKDFGVKMIWQSGILCLLWQQWLFWIRILELKQQ